MHAACTSVCNLHLANQPIYVLLRSVQSCTYLYPLVAHFWHATAIKIQNVNQCLPMAKMVSASALGGKMWICKTHLRLVLSSVSKTAKHQSLNDIVWHAPMAPNTLKSKPNQPASTSLNQPSQGVFDRQPHSFCSSGSAQWQPRSGSGCAGARGGGGDGHAIWPAAQLVPGTSGIRLNVLIFHDISLKIIDTIRFIDVWFKISCVSNNVDLKILKLLDTQLIETRSYYIDSIYHSKNDVFNYLISNYTCYSLEILYASGPQVASKPRVLRPSAPPRRALDSCGGRVPGGLGIGFLPCWTDPWQNGGWDPLN